MISQSMRAPTRSVLMQPRVIAPQESSSSASTPANAPAGMPSAAPSPRERLRRLEIPVRHLEDGRRGAR